ncbi:hypothetical protein BKA70DRAFT_1296695 [Coprinopsis sp. MPI-PUGE-AT-0042]|nr:hypothetical protein BKA70DRAFT_1296695 [Coprinopsis sp. MPI-PUGE-AT-0042]
MAYFSRAQSTPVKIAKPTSEDEARQTSPAQARKDSASKRQCRNIVIYGHCKYQDKGCSYYHPSTTPEPVSPTPAPAVPYLGSQLESPASTLTAQAVNAPVFVPKSTAPIFTPASTTDTGEDNAQHEYQDYEEGDYDHAMEDISHQMGGLNTQYYGDYTGDFSDVAAAYYAPPVFVRQPLNYHLYTPTTYPDLQPSTANSHYVPPSAQLRQTMQQRSEEIRGIAPPGLNLPEELQGYHTLVPLEPTGQSAERRKFGNWYSTVYRAIKASDGLPYILRRIENYRLIHASAFAPIEFWNNLGHPGIVTIKEAFTTRSFDDNSLVVVYAYHAGAKTLFETYIKHHKPAPTTPTPSTSNSRFNRLQGNNAQQQGTPSIAPGSNIPERTVWSFICQLAVAIKRVHESGHAVRGLDASKVLLTGQNRIRLSSCGTMDILMHDVPQDVHTLQQEDLTQFGRLIFALCCGSTNASSGPHFQKSVDHLSRGYGQEIKSLALWLISKQTIKSIDQVLDSIRHKIMAEQEDALHAADRLEVELQGELENARVVRLMTKLGFINERPEFAREPRWSETGDRYIIKLFRDFVFHQVDEHGNPVLDMSHVMTCLNKLDAGTDERVMLVARDEQSCLVVSYKEIKNCMDGAFSDLAKSAIASPAAYKHR